MLLAAAALLILRPWERQRGPARAGGGRRLRDPRVDGDTIEARIGGRVEDVRYIGVDTPETVKPDTPVQCFGPRASALQPPPGGGRRVRLVFGVERRDVYGRLLAYVYLGVVSSTRPRPPRPRPNADDPAQRPLRAAVSAPGAAYGAGRTRASGAPADLSCRDASHISSPASSRAPLLRCPAAPRATDLCECVKASPSSSWPSSRRPPWSAAVASSCAAGPPIARGRGGSPAASRTSKVRFSVLAVCLTVTVVVVVVSMFEALAFLMA